MRVMNARIVLLTAALFLLAGVALGAFGAHALKAKLAPDLLAIYQTAVQYHFWHALGLLAVGVLLVHRPDGGALVAAAWLLGAGIIVFCGSLYALALTGTRGWGAVAPVGGVAFLAGWAALAWAAWRW
jgi:uncharacterized membrane protein YgdD (TMEM256/DUF423 family)